MPDVNSDSLVREELGWILNRIGHSRSHFRLAVKEIEKLQRRIKRLEDRLGEIEEAATIIARALHSK